MNRRHVITGAPGSGKTSVVRDLAAAGFATVPEAAREVIAQQRAKDGDAIYESDPKRFLERMLSRTIADFERLALASRRAFFDRGIPDQIGYAELFDLDPAPATAAARELRYDDPVFVLPANSDFYVADEDRRMTFEVAKSFGDRVRGIYQDLGYRLIDVPRDAGLRPADFILETFGLQRDGP